MPTKPRWWKHIPEIVGQLELAEVPVLDRAGIERLFRLGRRQAIYLMQRLGGYRTGNAVLIDRERLIEVLNEIASDPDYSYEERRRERVGEALDKAASQYAATQVRIPIPRDGFRRRVPDLPEDIQLQPGLLEVRFNGAEDLMKKLFELATAAANDFDRFVERVEPAAGGMITLS
jgi:hypothetical protein